MHFIIVFELYCGLSFLDFFVRIQHFARNVSYNSHHMYCLKDLFQMTRC